MSHLVESGAGRCLEISCAIEQCDGGIRGGVIQVPCGRTQ